MKQIIGLFLSCLVLIVACKKDNDPGFRIIGFNPGKGAANIYVTISGEGFDTLVANIKVAFNGVEAPVISTTSTTIITMVPAGASSGKITVTINNKKAHSPTDFVILPGKWVQKGVMPPYKGRVLGLGFAVGNKGYVTTGDRIGLGPQSDRLNDMLEFDPSTGTWTEKTPLPLKITSGLGMVIDNKIYLGIGVTDSGTRTNQFWRYDPASDHWTRKADFPGELRNHSIGFGLSGKGYAGTGLYNGMTFLKDWWQYDPATDVWTRKADFSGPEGHFYTGFVLNGKIYMGVSVSTQQRAWWEYDVTNDAWIRRKDYPGNVAWGASGVVIANRGYVMGAGTECWEYIPSSDSWVQKAFFGARYMGVAFGINDKGYYVTGYTAIGGSPGELDEKVWEFSPQ